MLAITARRLGYSPVRAYDNDPGAIEATVANAARNGVSLDEVRRADIRADRLDLGGATVGANLVAPLLLALAGQPTELPSRLIASGLLTAESDRVAQAFAQAGLHERARRARAGWVGLLLAVAGGVRRAGA